MSVINFSSASSIPRDQVIAAARWAVAKSPDAEVRSEYAQFLNQVDGYGGSNLQEMENAAAQKADRCTAASRHLRQPSAASLALCVAGLGVSLMCPGMAVLGAVVVAGGATHLMASQLRAANSAREGRDAEVIGYQLSEIGAGLMNRQGSTAPQAGAPQP